MNFAATETKSTKTNPLIMSHKILGVKEAAVKHFDFAVNRSGKNKDFNKTALTNNFQTVSGTLENVRTEVLQGHAVCAGILLPDSRRCANNVIGSSWVLIDIDNKASQPGFTIEQALEHPFIKEFGSLIYTTANHKSDWHKFRIILMLPEFVEAEALKLLIKRVMAEFPEADKGCSDVCRVFYGNTEAEFPLFNHDVCLPMEWVEDAKKQAERGLDEKSPKVKGEKSDRQVSADPSYEPIKDYPRAVEALKYIYQGLGYDEWLKIGMALHSTGDGRLKDLWIEFSAKDLSGAEKYSTQKLNTVIRENSILSANSAFFFNDADAGGGLA
jgi:hypothetical protein